MMRIWRHRWAIGEVGFSLIALSCGRIDWDMSKWVQNFFRVLQNFYHHVFMLYEDLFGTDVIMVCVSLSPKTVDILSLSYSYGVVDCGVRIILSSMGYAKENCGFVWMSLKYGYMETVHHCLMWCIWWEHNGRSFERPQGH